MTRCLALSLIVVLGLGRMCQGFQTGAKEFLLWFSKPKDMVNKGFKKYILPKATMKFPAKGLQLSGNGVVSKLT